MATNKVKLAGLTLGALVLLVGLGACADGSEDPPEVRATPAGNDVPRPKTSVPELALVIAALAQSAELHDLSAPAMKADLAFVEKQLGRKFPPAFRALYEISDGAFYLQGNLMLDPLRRPDSFGSVLTISQHLRQAGASLPPELVVIGSDGSDALFALWLPKGRARSAPAAVVELDVTGEPFALVGTDLARFLRSWTAYYLILIDADSEALDALGVPRRFRISADEADGELLFALRRWADPKLPDPRADPYRRPTSTAELRRLYGADGTGSGTRG